MKRFIFLTFIVLGWAFWELSGGASFEPAATPEVTVTAEPASEPSSTIEAPTDAVATAVAEAATTPESTPAVTRPDPEPQPALEPQPAEPPQAEPIQTETAVVAEPEPEPTPAPAPTLAQDAQDSVPSLDMRVVDATRVNMRSGPSTDYRVLDTLSRGTIVEILEIDTSPDEPWVRMLVVATGLEGWMAERFLIRQQ